MGSSKRRATTSSQSVLPLASTALSLPSASTDWRPDAYQKKAVRFLLEHAAAALFLDTGLGKTSIALAAFKFLKDRGLARRALVIAPLRPCYMVWPAEKMRWTDFHSLGMAIVHGRDKEDLLAEGTDICVTNPDSIAWMLGAETVTSERSGRKKAVVDVMKFRKLGFDTLIADELTMFKDSNSLRFKMMREIIGTFGRRWGMTASPAANSLMNLFGQMYVVDQGRSFGQFITHFRHRYFVPGYDGYSWEPQEGAEERIYSRIAPVSLRMDADDYIDLPPVVNDIIETDIGARARMFHNELLDELIADLGEKKIVAANAGVATGKCRQVTGGAIWTEEGDGRMWREIHSEKLLALRELAQSMNGQPLMVAYEFRHEAERIRRYLSHDFPDIPVIGGGTTPKQAIETERRWNAGEIPVMLVHPQSVGHGLNLQRGNASHLAWYTLTWDNELHYQLIRRLRRRGTGASRIFVHYLIAQGTVDRVVYNTIMAKEKGQQALFAGLKKLARERK